MTPEHWRKIESLVEAALAQPAPARAAFLDAALGSDETGLRSVVDGLLTAHHHVADQLETPALDQFLDPQSPNVTLTSPSSSAPHVVATDTHVGPYRIVRTLGKGGMGEVFLAERNDDLFDHRVAIKLVLPSMAPRLLESRFHRERQILAKLEHPNIARLYDGGQTADGRSFLVMEFVEGLPLDEYCARHQPDLVARLDLFAAICNAVRYAHQNLIVHRDLKPSNVLVMADGTVKLLDFGIAKLVHPEDGLGNEDTTFLGLRPLTPNYASPEQLRGDTISTTTDVYALGVVLHQLLTGERPYTLDRPDPAALDQMLIEGLRLPSSIADARTAVHPVTARSLRGDLDTIVLRCLQREPERRFGSVEALSEDLHRYRVGLPIRARKDTVPYRLGRFLKRNRLTAALLATIFLLTASLAGAMAWQAYRVGQEQVRTARERDKAATIRDFLRKVFDAADPFRSSHSETSALEMIQRATEVANADLASQPLLQASIQVEAARILNGMSLYQDSLVLTESAIATFEAHEDPDASEFLRAIRLHGGNLQWMGRLSEATEYHERATAMSRTIFGPSSPEVASSLYNLSLAYGTLERNSEAEEGFRQVLEIDRAIEGADSERVAEDLTDLAATLLAQGKYAETEPLLQEALEIQRKMDRSLSIPTAKIFATLGILSYATGDIQNAIENYSHGFEVAEQVLGDAHHYTASLQTNLAACQADFGNLASAAALTTNSRKKLEELATSRSPATGFAMIVQGQLALLRDDNELASIALEEAFQTFVEIDPDHPDAATTLLLQARLLRQTGHLQDASATVEQARAIWTRRSGGPNYDPHKIVLNVAALELLAGDAEGARDRLRASRATLAAEAFPNQLTSNAIHRLLAVALMWTGQSEEAVPMLRDALRFRTEQLRDDHWDTIAAMIDLAQALRAKDHDEASELYNTALSLARDSAEEPPVRRRQALQALALDGLATLDRQRGNDTAARQRWHQAADLLAPLVESTTSVEYRGHYAKVLLALGSTEKAAPILTTLFEKGWRPPDLIHTATQHGLHPTGPPITPVVAEPVPIES